MFVDISFDYSELRGKIKSKNLTQEKLAERAGMKPPTLSTKLNGNGFFKQKEIIRICEVLEIKKDDIGLFFYTPIV